MDFGTGILIGFLISELFELFFIGVLWLAYTTVPDARAVWKIPGLNPDGKMIEDYDGPASGYQKRRFVRSLMGLGMLLIIFAVFLAVRVI